MDSCFAKGKYPSVSIIIPFYQNYDFLRKAVGSALLCGIEEFEIIIVDDGSPTVHTLSSLGIPSDERIRLIRSDVNLGGGGARNIGIDAATKEWTSFLDSDDEWVNDKLKIQFDGIDRFDTNVVAYGKVEARSGEETWRIPERGIRNSESVANYLFVDKQVIQTDTILCPTSLSRKVRFADNLRKHQDIDFCIRAHKVGAEFVFCDKIMATWHCDPRPQRVSNFINPRISLAWIDSIRKDLTHKEYYGFIFVQVVPQLLRLRAIIRVLIYSALALAFGAISVRDCLRTTFYAAKISIKTMMLRSPVVVE